MFEAKRLFVGFGSSVVYVGDMLERRQSIKLTALMARGEREKVFIPRCKTDS
jgi:hypothetical protein